MAPLSKELVETTTSLAEPTASPAPPPARTPGAHLRSDALSLEIPVKVHGSKVTQVVREITPHTEPFEEQTTTMIVFPQGGVLKMSTAVSSGQMLVVTNLRSKQDAICRIVKVRTFSNAQAYVEVEFTNRQAGYWGVYFPSDGPVNPKAASPQPASQPAQQPQPSKPAVIEKPLAPASSVPVHHAASDVKAPASKPAAPAPAASVPPSAPKPKPKPETVFAQIGSHEEVQPAAAAMVRSPHPGAESHLTPAPASVPPSVSIEDLRGDRRSSAESLPLHSSAAHPFGAPLEPAPRESSASSFGTFSGAGILGNALSQAHSASDEFQPSHFDSASREPASGSGRNWLLIAAAAVLFVTAGGGFIYYRNFRVLPARGIASTPALAPATPPAVTASSQPVSAPPSSSLAAAPPANSPIVNFPSASAKGASAAEPPKPSMVVRARPIEPPAAAKSNKLPPAASAPADRVAKVESAQPKLAAPQVASNTFQGVKLDAHPRSRASSANASAAAPDVPAASATGSGALTGFLSSANAAPPAPEVAPSAPVRAGGLVKEPRLVSRVMPIYPIGARSASIEGDVVISISIGKDGKVTDAKVVSGPSLLRAAALDAVRHWKYQPSTLDGEPIVSQTQVTVGFHL